MVYCRASHHHTYIPGSKLLLEAHFRNDDIRHIESNNCFAYNVLNSVRKGVYMLKKLETMLTLDLGWMVESTWGDNSTVVRARHYTSRVDCDRLGYNTVDELRLRGTFVTMTELVAPIVIPIDERDDNEVEVIISLEKHWEVECSFDGTHTTVKIFMEVVDNHPFDAEIEVSKKTRLAVVRAD